MDSPWLEVFLASLPVAGAIIVAFVPRWAEVRERRRTRYAEAVEALVAWAEFPYRVARRVSDDPSVIAELAARGHELQQRVAFHEAWVNCESEAMGRLYSEITDAVRAVVGPAIQAAWTRPPATRPSDMNMNAMGIDRAVLRNLLNRLGVASRTRFGWRRLFEAGSSRRDPVFTDDIEPPIG